MSEKRRSARGGVQMGEGLTDYRAKQIIDALKGIERQLKIHNKREAARDARRDDRQAPPEVNPWGYTE